MKKHLKRKSFSASTTAKPDIAGLIFRMQQQLTSLEKKIDTLIGQSPQKPFDSQQHPKPFPRFEAAHRHGDVRQENGYRQRTLHKAICADCSKECEVPFKPSGDRPVYCKECFAKRRANGTFKPRGDTKPREEAPVHAGHADTHRSEEGQKFYEKIKKVSRKRKKA